MRLSLKYLSPAVLNAVETLAVAERGKWITFEMTKELHNRKVDCGTFLTAAKMLIAQWA